MNRETLANGFRKGCGLLLSILLLCPFLTGFAGAEGTEPLILIDDGAIVQGVHINSLDVSGKSQSEATKLLQSEEGIKMLSEAKLVLTLPGSTIEVSLSDLSATPKLDEAVQKAVAIGRIGGMQERSQAVETAKTSGTSITIPYAFDEAAVESKVKEIAASIPRESKAGTFTFDTTLPERFVVEDGQKGYLPDEAGLLAAVKAALTSGQIQNVAIPGTPAADSNVETLKPGTKENTVLIAKFTTKVSGSSGRVSNIKTGAKMINGSIVQPGETFSINDTLGPRVASAGIWRKAPTNVSGKHVSDYGGGLCQVSTTLFNAVIRSDLEIVEWVHHSIPSAYVQIGCDATVSTGVPDFKFKNNTDWPVYIVYYYETKTRKLTCEVWGRPLPDGKRIEIAGKRTGTKAIPATIYSKDPSKVRSGRKGTYSKTYKIWYDANGKEINRELIDENLYPAFAPIKLKK